MDIWEIKPANQTHYEQNKAKWSAMNEHVKKHGWRFTVITEVGIDKLKTKEELILKLQKSCSEYLKKKMIRKREIKKKHKFIP